jgi:Tfp pilus assembly protein PilO
MSVTLNAAFSSQESNAAALTAVQLFINHCARNVAFHVRRNMEQPAMYNLMTAAAAAGINRSTVLRAIKAGRISAQRDGNNGWQIDPAEFHRVFPPLPLPASASAQQDQQQTGAQVALLRNVIEELRKDKEELRRGLEDLRQDRDRWHAAFEAVQRQLPRPTQPGARVDNAVGHRWQRAWRWMRATG